MAADATVTTTFDAPPTASITAPQDGMSYNADAVPAAAFACSYDRNSALRSCLATSAALDKHAQAHRARPPERVARGHKPR
jgi:hypothetical protein